jgi:hypothetical protein
VDGWPAGARACRPKHYRTHMPMCSVEQPPRRFTALNQADDGERPVTWSVYELVVRV